MGPNAKREGLLSSRAGHVTTKHSQARAPGHQTPPSLWGGRWHLLGLCWDGPHSAGQGAESPPPKDDFWVLRIHTQNSRRERGHQALHTSPPGGTVDSVKSRRGPTPSSFPDLPADTLPHVSSTCCRSMKTICRSHLHWVGCTWHFYLESRCLEWTTHIPPGS